ncbi:MAG: substrate-binding domain-containing protein [Ruminococcus sp.]
MKKVLCTLLAGAMLATAFAGCSGTESKDTQSENSTEAAKTAMTGTIYPITRESGSGTRGAFSELFEIVDADGNDAITETAESTSSTSVMMTTVAGNESSIGYVSLGSLSDEVKALQVDGADCNVENVKSGEYKISRPFNICYIDGKLSKAAEDFKNYILSTEGQAIVEEEGYIPMEDTTAYKAAGVSGKITLAGSTSVAPVMDKIKDAYEKLNPDVTIEIQESGSSAGIQSATEGAVDIGMSSRELSDEEAEALKSEQIALDGIAVIVNNSNPLENITSEQVKSIYLAETTEWDDIK